MSELQKPPTWAKCPECKSSDLKTRAISNVGSAGDAFAMQQFDLTCCQCKHEFSKPFRKP